MHRIHSRRRAGFTLIELLTALVILSLLGLMSYRGLSAVLDTREHVKAESEKWRRVDAFFLRFARDVRLAAPRPVRIASGTAAAWLGRPATGSEPLLEFSRFASNEGVDTARRLGYRLNEKREIELWLWPGLDVAPAVLPVRYAVLEDVKEFELQYLDFKDRLGKHLAFGARRRADSSGRAATRPARLRRGTGAPVLAEIMRRAERGVAIVMAMGVVSLAAIVATAILASQAAWARRAELSAQHAQALELLQAGGDWARAVLSDDRRSNSVDHPGEPWAMRLPPMPVENGELVGHIEDQQGLFNLNNVVTDGKLNPVQFARFQRLLSLLGLPAPLADALADWIDGDDKPQPGHGAEDEYYLSLDPPYRPANRPLIDIDELALVRGFDSGVRARLAPFVAALPGSTPVNVNTAPPGSACDGR